MLGSLHASLNLFYFNQKQNLGEQLVSKMHISPQLLRADVPAIGGSAIVEPLILFVAFLAFGPYLEYSTLGMF